MCQAKKRLDWPIVVRPSRRRHPLLSAERAATTSPVYKDSRLRPFLVRLRPPLLLATTDSTTSLPRPCLSRPFSHHDQGSYFSFPSLLWKQQTPNQSKITGLFLDCDNTLVLSEELAFEACADLANEILEKHGIPDRYAGPDLMQDFVGQNFRGMMISLQAKYKFELSKDDLEEYVKREEDEVIFKLNEKAQPCVGATEELKKLHESQKYDMAVVSSSALRRVQASIKKVGQDKYIDPNLVFSAASSLAKPTSKPDPAIYLHALKVCGKTADETVAIEDSKSGALSAIRAGIPVIGYVGSYDSDDKRFEMTQNLMDLGAKVIMKDWSEFEKCLAEIEASA